MNNDKIKLYKNPARQKPEPWKPYTPQYQLEGVDPVEYKSSVVPPNVAQVKPVPTMDNPRVRTQPYAEVVPSPVGIGRGPVPNIGNNMEHTWSGVDGQIIDDVSEEYETSPDHPMIDNNGFVTNEALRVPPDYFEPQIVHEDDVAPVIKDLDAGAYLLLIKGVPICSGPLEEIEDQARALIFGEHELCDGEPVPEDDLIVLKKLKLKVGVFLE